MITFDNGRFEAYRDKLQWVLTEYYIGKSRKGEEKRQRKITFHNNLHKMCSYIIDRCAGDCSGIDEIINLLQHAESLLDKEVNNELARSCQ